MVLKLYGTVTGNCERAALVLYEKELEFKLVKIDIISRENRSPDYLAKAPFGQVPSLDDDGFFLFGSQAIGRYIAEKYDGQGTPLLGNTLTEKARIYQWVEVEGQNFAPPATTIAKEFFTSSSYKRSLNEELIATQLEKLGKVLDIYDSHLSQNRYLAGDYYSLADLLHAPFLVQLKNVTGELITSRQHVAAWCDDLASRTAFKKVLESKWDSE
ncbi:hypothetical protein CY35_08G111600 [Sphagnum magellanicum]|nr:hypothetical protein CY35_08G111600 [Sphagnum magellanicum]KAH9555379.1 hypothetical protein CY35_08G111600 [Sphagnum magellanicum]